MVTVMKNDRFQRVFGEIKTRRTPEQILADRKKRGKRDHIAQVMDRNLRYEVSRAKDHLARKITEAENKDDVLITLEDMVPNSSLHKITV